MLDLRQPTRQSKKSVLLYVLKNIKGIIAIVLYSTFGARYLDNPWTLVAVIVVAAMILIVTPFIKYYFFTFHVEEDELIIQRGLLNKERKAIPLDRKLKILSMGPSLISVC